MNEKEISNPAHGCVVALVGFQLAVILLALGLISAYLPGSPSALVWPYEWV